jgi:hypothetical protein
MQTWCYKDTSDGDKNSALGCIIYNDIFSLPNAYARSVTGSPLRRTRLITRDRRALSWTRCSGVRLHLDDCNETNGPLRVAPGSHRRGILKSTDIASAVNAHGEVICVAQTGEAVVMRPLLLHASSPAQVPKHRRVLHVVYYSGEPIAEQWHRAVR